MGLLKYFKECFMKKVIFLFLASVLLFTGCSIYDQRDDDANIDGALILSLDSSTQVSGVQLRSELIMYR